MDHRECGSRGINRMGLNVVCQLLTGGRFLILNPRKDEAYAQRYFYKVKMKGKE